MNYYEPRQVSADADREDAGKWRYTCMNDGKVWPVGNCADNCPGHDTKEGAYEHQTEYVLDHASFDGQWSDTQHRCEAPVPTGGVNISGQITAPPTGTEACGKWTDKFASLGPGQMWSFNLCDGHRNRETLALLVGTVGDSMGSY